MALINGLQVSAALSIEALFKTELLFETALLCGSISLDAAQGSDIPFDERIHLAKGYKTQIQVARIFRTLLKGSEIREAHRDCNRVQDPYSLRCQPQIMGAVLHQIEFVAQTLQTEVNAFPIILSFLLREKKYCLVVISMEKCWQWQRITLL